MSDHLARALSDPGPHTAESLAERLPDFPIEAIRGALETLAQQGVLERREQPDGGPPEYRYVAPERYAQANLDVVRDPAKSRRR
jgi:predicted ArsR family transcriptional regulator